MSAASLLHPTFPPTLPLSQSPSSILGWQAHSIAGLAAAYALPPSALPPSNQPPRTPNHDYTANYEADRGFAPPRTPGDSSQGGYHSHLVDSQRDNPFGGWNSNRLQGGNYGGQYAKYGRRY